MPRPRSLVRPVEIKISIPMDLAAHVEELLWDPTRGKPSYGERSRLITDLLRRWVTEQSEPTPRPAISEGA